MGTLNDIFHALPSGTILNDGATSRDKADIRADLCGCDELDAEYALGYTSDGRVTITKIKDDGFLESIPVWVDDAPFAD